MDKITCREVFEDVLFNFDASNPICALSSLITQEGTNAELYKILVTDKESLTIDYLLNRYDRIMSPLFLRLYDHYEEDKEDTSDDIAKIIAMKFLFGWNKLAEALFADYNPIENYNMKENKETDFEEHTVTDNDETVTNKYSGFNSATPSEVSESVTDGTIDTTKTDTGSKAKNELTRSGNIGVTTSQQMIESEFNLRKKNLLDLIYKNIDTILFIDYYN